MVASYFKTHLINGKRHMNKLSQLLILSLAGLAAAPASGQIFINGRPAGGDTTAARKKAFERELATKIGDMKRACELSDAQVKKLQLAAKGAVASSMTKFKAQQKKMRERMRGMRVGGPGVLIEEAEDDDDEDAAEGEEADADEDEELVEGNFAVAVNAVNMIGGGRSSQISVATEPRWTMAISSVLTSEQKAAYEKAVKEREAFVRKTAVASFVARVDLKLLLSAEQRQKLTAVIDRNFGKQLGQKVAQQNQRQGMFFFTETTTRFNGKPPISHDELKPLLSEAQLGEWKSSFEAELDRLRRTGFNAVGGVGNNVIFEAIEMAAPLAPAVQIDGADEGDGK